MHGLMISRSFGGQKLGYENGGGERHGHREEQGNTSVSFQTADQQRDDVKLLDAGRGDGLPNIGGMVVAGPLARFDQQRPTAGVQFGVWIVRRFARLLQLDAHEELERVVIERFEFFWRQTEILLQLLRRGLVHVFDRDGVDGGRCVRLAENNRSGLAGDEDEDEENHQDGREGNEEDQALRQPFERTGTVSPF